MNEKEQATKQVEWDKLATQYREEVGDKLGRGLDEQTIDAVVGLNLLGFETTASCEGHMDHATGGPYLDIRCKAAELFEPKERAIYEAQGLDYRDNAPIEFSPEKYKEWEQIMEQKDEVVMSHVPAVQALLDEFHQSYPIGTFVARGIGDEIRIEPEEVDIYNGVVFDQSRLKKYQQELKEFSKFIKDKHLSTKNTHNDKVEKLS